MSKKLLKRAESLLMRDKYNEVSQTEAFSRDLEKFVSGYLEFSPGDYVFSTALTDSGLTVSLCVKVKKFKSMRVSQKF